MTAAIAAISCAAPAWPVLADPPINDQCATAIDIGLGLTPFTTLEGTADLALPPCAPESGVTSDVWFRFTPTFTGRVRLSTCGLADFDTVIAAYRGCVCPTGDGEVQAFRCNDNFCGSDARVVVRVQAGACCLIQIGGAGGSSGSGGLLLEALDNENAVHADVILTGAAAGDRFAQSVARAGDMNNDDLPDLAVGAHLSDVHHPDGGYAGVHVGPDFTVGLPFVGEAPGDQFGRVVAGGWDFDGDGFDDLLVGAPFNDDNGPQAGKVFCLSGFDNSLIWLARGQLPGDRFGTAVACVGDLTGDGVPEVLVGAPLNDLGGASAGRAYLLAGQNGSVQHIFTGKDDGEQFGAAVCAVGDVNGDGARDFVIAAPRSDRGGSNSGRVALYSGFTRTQLQVIVGAPGERLGSALAGWTGQVGASTLTCLALGAPNNSIAGPNAGQVRIYRREHDAPSCAPWLCPAETFNGEAPGDRFGAAVALGDVFGGGQMDLLVGAPGSDLNGPGSGAAYIYNGGNGTLWRRTWGEAAGDALGTSLAAAGDLNADGRDDYILGAPLNDAGGEAAGRAYIFLSSPPQSALAMAIDLSHDEGQERGREHAPHADVTGDFAMSADDVLAVLLAWGACETLLGGCDEDLDGDGAVTTADLLLVVGK
jgi:hypothetical protein